LQEQIGEMVGGKLDFGLGEIGIRVLGQWRVRRRAEAHPFVLANQNLEELCGVFFDDFSTASFERAVIEEGIPEPEIEEFPASGEKAVTNSSLCVWASWHNSRASW